ncbi:GGDEF domain-containing protein [Lachnospiraceae bacterium]|nr:GGDEF domain-containing protein [Lachnospiraceae bacterium]
MKILKIHLIEIAAVLLFVLLALVFCSNGREAPNMTENICYDNNWTLVTGGETKQYETLPEKVDISGYGQEVILQKRLPEKLDFVNAIGFYTSHQFVEVYVDGEKVYEKKVSEKSNSRTPGNCWNFVQIWNGYSGKLLEIHIQNCYDWDYVKVPEFVCGLQTEIVMDIIKDKFISFTVSYIVLAMGLMLVIGWVALGRKMYLHKGIPWLGLFAMHFAVWSAFETQIPMIMFGRELLFSQVTILSLKLMPLPIIYFMKVAYFREECRLLSILAVLSELDVAVSLTAQFLGWFDLRQTLFVTHIIGISVAAVAVVMGVQYVVKKGKKEVKTRGGLWKNAVCIAVVGVCVILDAVNYYYRFHDDVAYFSRIACLIYVVVLAGQFLSDSVKLIQVGKEAEAILEEAELDGLTLLKNRRSFEQELHQINKGEFRKYGVVMFDLNNLKMMNDLYGHGMGDCYIITGSEIIRDVFGDLGEIYRIGGDEFCLISDSITEEIYEQKRIQMCDWLANLQGTQVKDFMQIASGFAKYSRGTDMNLQDTVGRADERMYQCKRAQKEAKNNSGKV